MNYHLNSKVAVITGASKGIGFASAEMLAESGAEVIVVSRKEEAVARVAEKLREKGAKAHHYACNVGSMDELEQLVSWIKTTFGAVHILVNNAATNPVYGSVMDCELSAYEKIMEVNVKGPLQLARLLHPLLAKEGGSVINISSIGGVRPEPGLGYYSISKAALNMMSKVLAKEWGPDGIRVNTICPGLIKTKFSEALWSDQKTYDRFTRQLPISRMGSAEEVASMVAFLASEASSYSTGGVFFTDGGFSI